MIYFSVFIWYVGFGSVWTVYTHIVSIWSHCLLFCLHFDKLLEILCWSSGSFLLTELAQVSQVFRPHCFYTFSMERCPSAILIQFAEEPSCDQVLTFSFKVLLRYFFFIDNPIPYDPEVPTQKTWWHPQNDAPTPFCTVRMVSFLLFVHSADDYDCQTIQDLFRRIRKHIFKGTKIAF